MYRTFERAVDTRELVRLPHSPLSKTGFWTVVNWLDTHGREHLWRFRCLMGGPGVGQRQVWRQKSRKNLLMWFPSQEWNYSRIGFVATAAATSLQKKWKVEVMNDRLSAAWTAAGRRTCLSPAVFQFLRRDLYDWEETEEWEYQRTLKEHVSYYLHWDFSRRHTHGPLGVPPQSRIPLRGQWGPSNPRY